MVIGKWKNDENGESICELVRIYYLKVCKNIVKKFLVVALLLKWSMIMLRGQSIILLNEVAKISTYIYIHILILLPSSILN